MAKASIRIEIEDIGQADKLLAQLPIELREKILLKAIRKAGNIVAKEARRQAPKPGYPGDKPGKIPLNKTIRVVIRKYKNKTAGYVGPEYPYGAHGHLVEYGHEIANPKEGGKTRTVKNPFMRRSADSTYAAQQTAIISTLQAEAEKHSG